MAFIAPALPAIYAALASAAVATISAVILAPHQNSGVADHSATVLTERGSPLPLLIGRRRVNGFLVWAGDRTYTGGGGGKGFGGGGGGASTYHEAGWQILCVGPAWSLTKIVESGKIIWHGNITRADTPSGSHLHTKSGECFIYWGEIDQPIDPVLSGANGPEKTGTEVGGGAGSGWVEGTPHTPNKTDAPPSTTGSDGIGVASRWPCVCYVVWNKKNLGGSPQWPLLEYELTVKIDNPVLVDSPAWLSEATSGDGTDGPNPAHVLWQLLTAPGPWGFSISPNNLDTDAFEALGVLFSTEHQSCHILSMDGVSGVDLFGQIMTDLGIVMPQIGDKLVPYAIRPVDPSTLPVISDSLDVLPAPPVVENLHDPALPTRLVFVIKDEANAYRDTPIIADNDGQAGIYGRNKPTDIPIPTCISRHTALRVVGRRTQEILTNPQKFTLKLARGARQLRCGQAFILAGYGQLRVATTDISSTSRTVSLVALADQYSGQPDTYIPADITSVWDDPNPFDIAADVADVVEELPAGLVDSPALAILRARANVESAGANVWVSAAGTTYTKINTDNGWAAGGTLDAGIDAGAPTIIDEGPTITAYNPDIADVLDLSSDDLAWRTGTQIAIVNEEIFFLKSVTAIGNGQFRLDGLIRARFDSRPAAHSAGTAVMIVQAASIKPIATSLLRPNRTFYVKVQPFNAKDIVDISSCTAIPVVTKSLRAVRPLPTDNFAANFGSFTNQFSSGQDIVFSWNYRVKDGGGRAADEVDAGVAIPAGTPAHEGEFRIRIYSGGTIVRTILVNDDTGTTTYSNATLVADFGGEPTSFSADLTNISGSNESLIETITVTKP